MTKPRTEIAIARSRAYELAGNALRDYRPSRTESDAEYDERYRLMNHLYDRAIAVHPAPLEAATFNPDYANEPLGRR